MLRRTVPRANLFQVLREELGKIPAMFRHDVKSGADFILGADETERQKKVREAHRNLEALDAEKAKEAAAERAAKMSYKERANHFLQEMRHSFSTQSSVVALVQHCTRAHMAETAVDLGIDVKNVNVVVERSAVGSGSQVVGYIDAPMASREEVMAYASKLQDSCPAASLHADIEWRQVEPPMPKRYEPSSSPSSGSRYQPGSFDKSSSGGGSSSSSSSLDDEEDLSLPFTGMGKQKLGQPAPTISQEEGERIARGMPGMSHLPPKDAAPASSADPATSKPAETDAADAAASPADHNRGGFHNMQK